MHPATILITIVGGIIGGALAIFLIWAMVIFLGIFGGLIAIVVGIIAIFCGQWWGFIPLIIGIPWAIYSVHQAEKHYPPPSRG